VVALCAIDAAVVSVGGVTDASVAPKICLVRGLMDIFVYGLINRSGGHPWQVLITLGT
jgi:hypothetical protein